MLDAEVVVLNSVDVHDRLEVADVVVLCRHRGFPDAAFLHFTVTEHHPRLSVRAVEASRKRATEPKGKSHPEGASRKVDPRAPLHVHVTLADAAFDAVGLKIGV